MGGALTRMLGRQASAGPGPGGPFTTTGLYGLADATAGTDYVAGAEFDSRQITASPCGNATCTGIAVFFGSSVVNGGKIKVALYADSSGAPGSLLASANEYVIATADALTTKNLLFTSSVTLTAGTKYWIAWITDSASHFRGTSLSGVANTKWASYTYASGVPSPAPSVPNSSTPIISKAIISVAQGVAGYWDQETIGDYNLAANEIDVIPITTPASGTCSADALILRLGSTVTVGGKMKGVIYDDSSGSPNNLIATGSEVTVASANTELSSTFSGITLQPSTQYWIGCHSDNASKVVGGPSTRGGTKWKGSLTYGTPPSTLSGTTNATNTAGFYLKFS